MTIQTDNTRLQPLCMRSGTVNSRVGGGLFTPPLNPGFELIF